MRRFYALCSQVSSSISWSPSSALSGDKSWVLARSADSAQRSRV